LCPKPRPSGTGVSSLYRHDCGLDSGSRPRRPRGCRRWTRDVGNQEMSEIGCRPLAECPIQCGLSADLNAMTVEVNRRPILEVTVQVP
jgi:hypothetical protein